MTKSDQNAWLNYILMNNAVFGKTMDNVGKHRDIKLVITQKGGIIWYQRQIIILHSFPQNIY